MRIESNHGAPLNRCPLCFGVSFFVPGLPDTKLKISRAESRIVTEPKVATPRRTARTVHPRAVQPREVLRTALVWAKLTLSSPVYPDTVCFEVDWRRTTTICSCPIFCGVCSRRSDFLPAKHGPAGYLRTELRRICMEASAIEGNVAEEDADFLRSWRIAVARPATPS